MPEPPSKGTEEQENKNSTAALTRSNDELTSLKPLNQHTSLPTKKRFLTHFLKLAFEAVLF